MIVRINFLEHNIEVKDDTVFAIECINKSYFYRIITLWNQLAHGVLDENLKVFEKNEEMNYSSKVEILIDYFNFEFTDKKYQVKLIELLSQTIEQEDRLKIISSLQKIRKLIEKNLIKVDIPIYLQKEIDIESIFKMLKLSIRTEDTLLEKLFTMIDIEKNFHFNKLLVFVNLKEYLSKEELNEFYKYAIYNQISVLMIDNKTYGTTIDNEHKLIIDENLNEFML